MIYGLIEKLAARPACYSKRFCTNERIRARATGPADQHGRSKRQLRPPRRNRGAGIVNECGVRELQRITVFVPKLQSFPEPFAKSEDNPQHVAHRQMINRSSLLLRQLGNKSHRGRFVPVYLKHTEGQGNDRA